MGAADQTTKVVKLTAKFDAESKAAIDAMATSIANVNKNTKQLASNFRSLTSVFQGWLGFLGVRQIVELSDSMQNLKNRIAAVSGGQEQATKIMEQLLNVAQKTSQPIETVGEAYSRFAVALQGSKVSSGTLTAFIETLTNSFKLAGSNTVETTGAIIQLTQAFSRGKLQGQEFRSVMQQNATVAAILREKFGQNLFKNAEKGLITTKEFLKIIFENMDKINTKAQVLAPTIGQTLTKAFNLFEVQIGKINEKFGVSSAFAQGVDLAIEKLPLLGIAMSVIAVGFIPALIVSIGNLSKAFILLAAENPLILALSVLAVVIVTTSKNVDDFIDKFRSLNASILSVKLSFLELTFAVEKFAAKGLNKVGFLSKGVIGDLAKDLDEIKYFKEQITQLQTPTYSPLKDVNPAESYAATLKKAMAEINTIKDPEKEKKIKEVLSDLNKEFLAGIIPAHDYAAALDKFDRFKLEEKFRLGQIELDKFNEGIRKLDIRGLNRDLASGSISIVQYNEAISKNKLEDLNEKLKFGIISLKEYNVELAKISEQFSAGGAFNAGTQSYIDSLGTSTQQLAKTIEGAFQNLETVFVNFAKTGKANFADMTQAILDDLLKIILRASIIQPLAQGILNFSAPSTAYNGNLPTSGPGPHLEAANGAAFNNGLIPFAKGGVVSNATAFGFGNNKTGVMGEAGPEAILPLSRGAGGKLGVQASINPVTINIINQSEADVQQSEKTGPNGEKMIEVMIKNKVREGIAKGDFDKSMKQAFGIGRKGA